MQETIDAFDESGNPHQIDIPFYYRDVPVTDTKNGGANSSRRVRHWEQPRSRVLGLVSRIAPGKWRAQLSGIILTSKIDFVGGVLVPLE
jgi:hypothetical protein